VPALQAPARPVGLPQPVVGGDVHAQSTLRGTRRREMTALAARQLPA
jgi:hypothetical protein